MNTLAKLMLSLLAVTAFHSQCQAAQYTVRNLGTFGGIYAEGTAINENGQIAGNAQVTDGVFRPFTWDEPTGVHMLDALAGCGQGYGRQINDSGLIVGYSYNIEDYRACVWEPDEPVRQLDTISGLGFSYARAVNNQGLIVGSCTSPDWTKNHLVFWDTTGKIVNTVDMGSRGIEACAITESGCVVGGYGDASFTHAFVWDSVNGFRDIGGTYAKAFGVNDAGQVVGYTEMSDGKSHAFIWDSTNGMRGLGIPMTYSSRALDINNNGQVVGLYGGSVFVWDSVSGMQLLDGQAAYATAINDAGQIVGFAGDNAVIWEPVPEPSSILAIFFGVAGLPIVGQWRKHRLS